MKTPDQPHFAAPRRERGFSLLELGVVLIFITVAALFASPRIAELLDGNRLEQAHQQLLQAILAAQSYRAVNGDYTDIDVEELVDNGYVLAGFTDGDDENVYSKDLVISPTTGGADAEFDYETDADEACDQLKERIDGSSYISVAPTCTTQKLEFTIN